MPGYRRSFMVRFLSRNSHQIGKICQFVTSVAAALVFGWMCAAPLLHLGNTDASGPAGCVSAAKSSSFTYPIRAQEDGAPAPGTIASGAGLELLEVGQ